MNPRAATMPSADQLRPGQELTGELVLNPELTSAVTTALGEPAVVAGELLTGASALHVLVAGGTLASHQVVGNTWIGPTHLRGYPVVGSTVLVSSQVLAVGPLIVVDGQGAARVLARSTWSNQAGQLLLTQDRVSVVPVADPAQPPAPPMPGWAPVELVDPSSSALRRSAGAELTQSGVRVGPALGAAALEAATLALAGVNREPRVARDGRLVVLGGMIWSLAHKGLEQLLGHRCELLGWQVATHVRPVVEGDTLLVDLENESDEDLSGESMAVTGPERQRGYQLSVWAEREAGPAHVLTWQPLVGKG